MDDSKLDLYDLWGEIGDVKMDAEKIERTLFNVSCTDDISRIFFSIATDYIEKVINSLENIENTLEQEIKSKKC